MERHTALQSMITLTLPYGSMQTHPAGTMGRGALAIKVNGELRDLADRLLHKKRDLTDLSLRRAMRPEIQSRNFARPAIHPSLYLRVASTFAALFHRRSEPMNEERREGRTRRRPCALQRGCAQGERKDL